MNVARKKQIWKFCSVIFIAANALLSIGCEVSAIEQQSAKPDANQAANKSQRVSFTDANLTADNTNALSDGSAQSGKTPESNANTAVVAQPNNLENAAANTSTAAETSTTPPVSLSGKSSGNARFEFAAAQNSDLSRNLAWTFGGKTQIGWYIYRPLICQTIGVGADVSDTVFAESLAGWQQANGISPNGILDGTTLAAFVAKWQANRLKIRGYPAPNELLTAPTDDFYDVSRPDELRQVERATYAAYKRLVAAAIADKSLNLAGNGRGELAPSEKFLKIVSSFRSREYQDKLRRESPNSGSAGLAVGNSPHFTGRALDIYVGGEPVTTKDPNRAVQINTVVYRWLVKNAGKFGFKPYFYEPWHWEYAPE